jgi:ParE toxin of type II toxin-antitoxin system, parDE
VWVGSGAGAAPVAASSRCQAWPRCERAVRQLRTIPQTAGLTILRALTPWGTIRGDRTPISRSLVVTPTGAGWRVGDYWVIYEIVDEQLILIVGVGHRREGCRALS